MNPGKSGKAPVRILAALALFAATATGPAAAGNDAAWPQRPLTMIVPFVAGGGGDTLARLYARELEKQIRQPIIIDNRAGAGGNIGTAVAARATPDGQTLVFGTNGTMATNHWLYKSVGYAPDDFEPVARFSVISMVLFVSPESPFNSVQELIGFAKKHPGELTCASAGNGTASHMACGLLQQMAKVDFTHVPYKGGAPASTDVRSGRVSFMIDVAPYLVPLARSKQIKVLAVSTPQRIPALPDVPTIAESGVPGYELFAWDGLFAPRGTPSERLDRLHQAVNAVLSDPAFDRAMQERGSINSPMSRGEFAAFVHKEYQRLGEIVKLTGARVD
ncbi:ABC transporter substrate-binding protein [Pigmentiphaga sp. NML080357]|uniref:Bug family tripartite tricarboxylate transporter substrate binding protein n=1 Tax=Pigmentiphaga sp. NML080357 TaxID=2008675 RepID=UPI000B413D0F|nr:tripartite tricarboxylate transporter substrate binding protein [Pigmentiphaga sp. NML080357]OVZ57862.1 ABC transporter substrate-binding protein [Pigmentiphaga sp. NML080357]